MKQTLDFLQGRPIYDYLCLVEFDEVKFDREINDENFYPVDSIDVYNFENDEFYPKIDYLEAFGDYAKDGKLFYRIYKGNWNVTQAREYSQRSGKSDWNNASREIKALGKIALNRDLIHLSFNFSGEGKHVETIKSPYLLEILDREIYNLLKDHLERFPISDLKSGGRSGYLYEFGKNLYPLFLYLKKYIFPDRTDKDIREFIVKFLSFVNERTDYKKAEAKRKGEKIEDRINEEKLKKLFLKKEKPPIKLNISGL